MTEYKQLVSGGSPDGMFTAGPVTEDNFFEWEALIQGPQDTPFEGGVFLAKLTFVSPRKTALILSLSHMKFPSAHRLPSIAV